MDAAELEQALADAGYDEARTAERIAAAREAAYSEPVAAPAPAAAAPAKVLGLGPARAKRAASTRWGLLSAAAIVALALGGSTTHYVAHIMPATTVSYPAESRPPSSEDLAIPWRRGASRLCNMGYYAECEDLLDEGRRIDPEGEDLPAVKALRTAIEEDDALQKAHHATQYQAKPGVAPGERPLQPRH